MLAKTLKLTGVLGLIYIIFWIFDKFNGSDYLTNYKGFLWNWWDWILIAIISYELIKKVISSDERNDLMEGIRENRFFSEIQRYSDTPYVPPITLNYLLQPPRGYSKFAGKLMKNTFYRTVMNSFRDRVYKFDHYTSSTPYPRAPYWRIVGSKNWLKISFFLATPLIWFSWIVLKDYSLFIHGWEKLTIPIMLWVVTKGILQLQAILLMRFTGIEPELEEGDNLKLYTWRELFPDKPLGEAIIHVWEAEKENRMRYEAQANGVPVPSTTADYQNPALAPYPFPNASLPEYTDKMEMYHESKVEEWTKPQSASNDTNVIPLRRKS